LLRRSVLASVWGWVPCPPLGETPPAARLSFIDERTGMATKDKNAKKSMEKKPALKTLKEKRQAKKNKK
jgi:hypothetical protein